MLEEIAEKIHRPDIMKISDLQENLRGWTIIARVTREEQILPYTSNGARCFLQRIGLEDDSGKLDAVVYNAAVKKFMATIHVSCIL